MEVILVKNINNNENIKMTLKKLVPEVRKLGSYPDTLVVGAINIPEIIKIPNIINKIIVKKIRDLNAIFWVLKTTIVVNSIDIIAITINKFSMKGKGKNASITIANA